MIIVQKHYSDSDCKTALTAGINEIFADRQEAPVFLCIGSDRHILDCFGPLAGTMIKEKNSDMLVFGTLDKPLHAKNLSQEIAAIKKQFKNRVAIAIDASSGNNEELGIIKIREVSLLPGKALSKGLPAIGDYSIIGMMGIRVDRRDLKSLHQGSL
ncbi:MAG: spore protease YyaC, partial [Syntrophomonadaceae bacterium]|nr:spore protease YyaC [Syntrophomonadaceae bacterium]